ncbi:MAG: hypothetical protein J6S60_01445 [Oscillospiraceae bacterium]|nr:hypothetical protein [Oscillospiraceae bacterium]
MTLHKLRIAEQQQREAKEQRIAAKAEAMALSQIPDDATEAERAVAVEKARGEHVELIVTISDPDGQIDDEDVIECAQNIRRRTVEERMAYYARRHPGAHIALYSSSQEMPIYIYR